MGIALLWPYPRAAEVCYCIGVRSFGGLDGYTDTRLM